MKEIVGDIWQFYSQGKWIVIPTNGDINRFGLAVMGRGLALEAKKRIPGLDFGLAKDLIEWGNHVMEYEDIHLFTFPVKHHWHEKADLDLIAASAGELYLVAGQREVYLPRVGCGNGRLDWKDVKPRLAMLDNRFTVVSLASDSDSSESSPSPRQSPAVPYPSPTQSGP